MDKSEKTSQTGGQTDRLKDVTHRY